MLGVNALNYGKMKSKKIDFFDPQDKMAKNDYLKCHIGLNFDWKTNLSTPRIDGQKWQSQMPHRDQVLIEKLDFLGRLYTLRDEILPKRGTFKSRKQCLNTY